MIVSFIAKDEDGVEVYNSTSTPARHYERLAQLESIDGQDSFMEFMLVTNHGEGCRVFVRKNPSGPWSISPVQIGKSQPFPLGWHFTTGTNKDNKLFLTISISLDRPRVVRFH